MMAPWFRRIAPVVLLIPAVAAAGTLGPRWPHDQVIRYDLGDAAGRVERLDVRLSPGTTDEVAREASFRYAAGHAPRVVTHEPRLANGDYTVEVNLTVSALAGQAEGRQATTHRRVTLSGGTTTLDLGPVVP